MREYTLNEKLTRHLSDGGYVTFEVRHPKTGDEHFIAKPANVALGRIILLKQEMEKNTEFDCAGAGENYKSGFLDALDACIRFVTDDS